MVRVARNRLWPTMKLQKSPSLKAIRITRKHLYSLVQVLMSYPVAVVGSRFLIAPLSVEFLGYSAFSSLFPLDMAPRLKRRGTVYHFETAHLGRRERSPNVCGQER